jgi:hypothetical protein
MDIKITFLACSTNTSSGSPINSTESARPYSRTEILQEENHYHGLSNFFHSFDPFKKM